METLQIQLNDKLSIDDLVALRDQGYSVMRSAHVGNLSPYNLALADAGIPMLLVDQNVTGIDKTYFPELVLSQAGQERVAEDGTVSLRTKVATGQFLDELHISGITDALPNATVFTNTEYVRRNERVATEIAALAVRNFPGEFERIVRSDGTTEKIDGIAEMVKRIGFMQLNDDPRAEEMAALIPVMVDIIINFVVEALESERDTQYHIAGPAMALYAREPKTADKLQLLYELVKQEASFGDKLPTELIVQLVPAASARFATSARFQSELSGLFAQLDESAISLSALSAQRKAFFTIEARKENDVRQEFEQENSRLQFAAERAVIEKALQVPGLFAASRNETDFITQYDVQKDGGLFVAPQNKQQSFGELVLTLKQLDTLRKKTRL